MACTKGSVTTGASKPTINTCVSISGSTVNVSLEGSKTEAWPFYGYVRLILQVESSSSDGWVQVTSKNAGFWNSKTANLNSGFTQVGYSGKTMRVVPEFYDNSNYTGKCQSDAEHVFYRP